MAKKKQVKKVGDLKSAKYNPRKITPEALKRLGKSMKEFGDLSGIIVNVRTGNTVGGHQRVKHFDPSWEVRKFKATDTTGTIAVGHIITPDGKIPYREVDWTEDKERKANIAAHKHGGDFDLDGVADILNGLDDIDADLLGFDEKELASLFAPAELKETHENLEPFDKTHVLLSFPPDKMLKIQPYLDKILKIEGVEYEQGSN